MKVEEFQEAIAMLEAEVRFELEGASEPNDIEELRRTVLGRKGRVKDLSKLIGGLPVAERPKVGQLLVQLTERLESQLSDAEIRLGNEIRPIDPLFDPTLPGLSNLVLQP